MARTGRLRMSNKPHNTALRRRRFDAQRQMGGRSERMRTTSMPCYESTLIAWFVLHMFADVAENRNDIILG